MVFIGAGNVATHLSLALQQSGCSILQVYSKTELSASVLGEKLQVPYSTSLSEINPDADVYIFSVKDSVLIDCIKEMPVVKGIFIHTAGSVPLSIFDGFTNRAGVFYPLQTFSKNRKVSFSGVPIFIETFNKEDEDLLSELANLISKNVSVLSSEKREYLHLSAVFACNFVNHIYDLASQILKEQNLPFDILLPLIKETAAKVCEMTPREAQTGPAVRHDKLIIQQHIELLTDENKKKIYEMLSQSICSLKINM
ncbi:MAG: DUF2520 domain-containing protein [Candidatus Azobacteroides sp.]|nr:DUF2520 domain-containing protein [Candidatus Azobacteroides sp.]